MSAEFCPSIAKLEVLKIGHRHGRSNKTNAREDRVLVRMAIQNRAKSSSRLAKSWGHRLQIRLSRFTVSRQLSAAGIRSRRPRKRAAVTVGHKRECVQWAQQHDQRNVRIWSRIRWSDESRFCLYHVDGRIRVWRRRGEDYNQDCAQPRPHAFGGSVTVSGNISYEHKTPLTTVHGNLNGTNYRDEILDVTVRPQQFQAEQPIFMDDNARQRAHLVDVYKVQHNIDSLHSIHESRLKPDQACVGCFSEGCKCPSTPCDHFTRAGHGPASRVEPDAPTNMSQTCSINKKVVNILMKFTLGKKMICSETTYLPPLFWFKDFHLGSQSQGIETFICSPKWAFNISPVLLSSYYYLIRRTY